MAGVLSKKIIGLKGDGVEQDLKNFLESYQAEFIRPSSTNKGHVYWVEGLNQWLLVMRKGKKAILTFHARDDCPCSKI